MPDCLLDIRGLTKCYGAPDSPAGLTVLHDISLVVAPGESLAVVGPSGCGKSTLLNMMGALDRPTAGSVVLDGTDFNTLAEEQLAAIRNLQIGFVFQQHHLLPQCTVLENVLVPTLAGHCDSDLRSARRHRAESLLDRVGLSNRSQYRPGRLSGGEAQRVAVVRALINEPRLLLADEPTGSLDRASAEALGELLLEMNRSEGVTLIVVTHNSALAEHMERIFKLENGGLVRQEG